MKLSTIKQNPNNPRVIRDARFYSLVKSLLCFPKMLAKRKIVLSSRKEPFSLGGNMRYKAIQHISILPDKDFQYLCSEYQVSDEDKKIWENVRKTKEISDDWIDWAEDFTEEEKKRFIIADNVGFGEWDWDTLGNEWDIEQLTDWGLEVPGWTSQEDDYSLKNKEIDPDDFEDKMIIKLEYTADEYEQVKSALHKIAATPEQAIWQLLGFENE